MNATTQLHGTGQRLWLDNITKALISSGTLAHYINDLSITGVTSNPTILEKAISGSGDYDEAIASALDAGFESTEELVFAVALEDLVAAADLLRPIFDASGGTDGYVSVEDEAFRFIRQNLDRANVFSFGIGSGVAYRVCPSRLVGRCSNCRIVV